MATTSFKQQCPGCRTTVTIKDTKHVGKRIECPKCKQRFVIEDPNQAVEEVAVVEETPEPAPAAEPEPVKAKPSFTSFKVTCPSCDAQIPIRDPKLVGQKTECTQCKYRFLVQRPAGAGAEENGQVEEAVTTKRPVGVKRKTIPTKFDEDDPPKKKKKKAGSNNMVLILGGGLAVVAVVLLMIGGYFIFFTGDDSGYTPPMTRRHIASNKKKQPTRTKKETPPKEKELVDITSLLPNESDIVVNIGLKELYNSVIGQAAFNTPGAFQREIIEQKIGPKVENLERVLIGLNTGTGKAFAVVRTSTEIDFPNLEKKLGLKHGPNSPIERKEYYVTRPIEWLPRFVGLVGTIFESRLSNASIPEAKPVSFALHQVDEQTVVVSDVESMQAFLEAGGKHKPLLTQAEAMKIIQGTKRYLTVSRPLKTILDRIEYKPRVLFSLTVDAGKIAQNLEKRLPDPIKVATSDFRRNLENWQAMGMAVYLTDNIQIDGAILGGSEKELHEFIEGLSRSLARGGTPTELKLGGRAAMLPLDTNFWQKDGPINKLSISTFPIGETYVVRSVMKLNPVGRTMMFQQLRPGMLTLRGMAEMAQKQPRIFSMAAAVQAYAKKHNKYPRGTAPAKPSAFGRVSTPDERLSWMVELLPFLGYEGLYRGLEPGKNWRPMLNAETNQQDRTNSSIGGTLIAPFLDPASSPARWWVATKSVPDQDYGATHYVGMAGVGLDAADDRLTPPEKIGIFGYDREVTPEQIKDGAKGTIAVIQVPPTYPRPWMAGGGATLAGAPTAGSIKPFVSTEYDGNPGTYAIMADGTVRFIPATISDAAFQALCTIAGGETVDLDKETTLIKPGQAVLKALE